MSHSVDLSIVQNYDPRCGMSKEEFEWRCAQHERVCQSMPQALNELQIQLQMMRHHFLDDPKSLKKWDEYERNVYHAFEWNLQSSLASPQLTPVSLPHTLPLFLVNSIQGKEKKTSALNHTVNHLVATFVHPISLNLKCTLVLLIFNIAYLHLHNIYKLLIRVNTFK